MSTFDDYGQGVSIATLTDPPNAEVLAKAIANALAGRGVMRFASASARTAALTGPSAPVEGMVSWLQDTNRLYVHNGSAWTPVAPVSQQGTATVSFSSQTSFTQTVNFPFAFSAVPFVGLNINDGENYSARWDARAISIGASSFTLFVYRGSGADGPTTWASVPVQWRATVA